MEKSGGQLPGKYNMSPFVLPPPPAILRSEKGKARHWEEEEEEEEQMSEKRKAPTKKVAGWGSKLVQGRSVGHPCLSGTGRHRRLVIWGHQPVRSAVAPRQGPTRHLVSMSQ